jgi:hypothetical protein
MTPRESLLPCLPVLYRAALATAVAVCLWAVSGARVSASDALPDNVLSAWATEKGLPGDIFAIAQDVNGYLWLGTPNGLIRFDGLRFTPWTAATADGALPSGPVHAIVGAADGSVWVGLGGGGGIVRIHNGVATQHKTSDGAPPGATAMIQDRQGAIWVATRSGLFRLASGRWTLIGNAHGYSGAEAFSLYQDPLLKQPNQTTALMLAAGLGWRDGSPAAPSYDQGSEQDAIEAIKLCLQAGTDINAATSTGETALHAAITGRGSESIVRFLVASGANLDAKNKQGRTPLDVAVASRRELGGIVAFLKQKMNPPSPPVSAGQTVL